MLQPPLLFGSMEGIAAVPFDAALSPLPLRPVIDDNSQTHWYLVRTKTGKERWVRDQLGQVVPEVFLPMLKAKAPRWGRMVVSIAPLFPCYVFARFDLQSQYFDVKYMAGVRAIVSAGTDPLAVPEAIVSDIRSRGVDDVIEIPDKLIDAGERVVVVEGPFRGFEAIFQRYLAGAERVAILLSAVESGGLRVVLSASAVVKDS
jgi:transcriptional antiterminator RfaH